MEFSKYEESFLVICLAVYALKLMMITFKKEVGVLNWTIPLLSSFFLWDPANLFLLATERLVTNGSHFLIMIQTFLLFLFLVNADKQNFNRSVVGLFLSVGIFIASSTVVYILLLAFMLTTILDFTYETARLTKRRIHKLVVWQVISLVLFTFFSVSWLAATGGSSFYEVEIVNYEILTFSVTIFIFFTVLQFSTFPGNILMTNYLKKLAPTEQVVWMAFIIIPLFWDLTNKIRLFTPLVPVGDLVIITNFAALVICGSIMFNSFKAYYIKDLKEKAAHLLSLMMSVFLFYLLNSQNQDKIPLELSVFIMIIVSYLVLIFINVNKKDKNLTLTIIEKFFMAQLSAVPITPVMFGMILLFREIHGVVTGLEYFIFSLAIFITNLGYIRQINKLRWVNEDTVGEV